MAEPAYDGGVTSERAPHRTDHRRGKLVVLAIIGLGLALGLVGYGFRRALPARPTTRPATQPATAPVTDAVSLPPR